jgi:hypothetical protein
MEREPLTPLYEDDDPDTMMVEHEALPRHTIIGLPAPERLPAEAPGARYRRLYPVQLDPPLEVTIHWDNTRTQVEMVDQYLCPGRPKRTS